jgi:major outer membrane protein
MKRYLFVFAVTIAALAGQAVPVEAQYGPSPFGYPGPAMLPAPYGMGAPYGMASPYGMAVGYDVAPPVAPPAQIQAPVVNGKGGCQKCCDPGFGKNCWFAYGEFMYLRPRNSEVAYGVAIDDATDTDPAVSPPIQVGRVGVVDIDGQPGYRFGGGWFLDEATAIQVGYTDFYGNTVDQLTAPAGGAVIRSLVSHPRTFDVASDNLDAVADYDIQFQLIDADYRSLIAYDCDYQIGYLIGVRYGEMRQRFDALFSANGSEFVQSEVNFYGTGLRGGLEAERYTYNRNFFFYGKTYLSLLGGESKARYVQGGSFDPVVVETQWKAGKVVTIYDLELGAGWQNECGNLRVSAGYLFSFWYNVVRTNEWINAVQENNFVDPSDNFNGMMSFDGLTARVEVRW